MGGKSIRLSQQKDKGTSAVWSKFDLASVDRKFSLFVKCVDCHTLLKWKPRDGTSGPKSHTYGSPANCKTSNIPILCQRKKYISSSILFERYHNN